MPALTSIMVLANVGLQLFNNWRSTNTNQALQQKHQEFQQASLERNHERMMQLLREGHTMQEQIEHEMHKTRIENIGEDFDKLIQRVFQQHALQKWPLSVLPMVMKNQSLGSYRANSDENIALHVIFTPSNCDNFNASIFPQIENELEVFCNQHWNTLSSHPILFYGEAWKSCKAPTDNEIAQLYADLPHLPALMITPYFRPDNGKLVFNIHMWGIGEKKDLEMRPTNDEFSKYDTYVPNINYDDDLVQLTIKEFVPYLQCMIGYLADVYFWSTHNIVPVLPSIFAMKNLDVNTKIQHNLRDWYSNIYLSNLEMLKNGCSIADSNALVSLFRYLVATTNVLDHDLFQKQLEALYLNACLLRGYKTSEINDAIVYASKNNIFLPSDSIFLNYFTKFHKVLGNKEKNKNLINAKKMKTLNATEYSVKRDELLNMIDQVLNVKGIKNDEKNTFLVTQKRLQENQFNIVLIGEYQGGKSTTFNALCGGREISPRGAMNKTSAICITATNLADLNAEEYAVVNWKSNEDLLKLMDSFIGTITAEDLGITLKENETFSIYRHFSFENIKHVEILKNIVEAQESSYWCDPDKHHEFNEILRIAKLIITFANNDTIKHLQKQHEFKIEDIAKFAVFPDEWEKRWTEIEHFNDIENKFNVCDVFFAFVSDINCYIHSNNLAQLGCSVTDCPGLFASSWDTSVAINAMSQANAVIYLLGGNKQMGEGDEKAITKIFQQKSLANKVFFAINRKDNDTITRNIKEVNANKLKNLNIPYDTIWDFNALLFFLSEFGQTILDNTLDNVSKEKFVEVAERNGCSADTVENLLRKIIRRIGVSMDDENLIEINQINNNTIATIRNASASDTLLTTINDSIVTQKAESILINNGAFKIKNMLEKIESRLKSTEIDALKTVEESEAEFQNATLAYQTFVSTVTQLLDEAFPAHLALQIARNGYTEIIQLTAIDAITLRLAVEIPKSISIKCKGDAAWQGLMKKFSNKQQTNWAARQHAIAAKKLHDLFNPIIRSAIETELSTAITLWENSIYDGTHNDFQIYIQPTLDSTAQKITKKWEDVVIESDLLAGFSMDKINSTEIMHYIDPTKISSNIDLNEVAGRETLKAIIQQVITEIVAFIASFIVGLVVDIALSCGLITVISTFGTWFYTRGKVNPDDPEVVNSKNELSKKQKQFYEKFRPLLTESLQQDSLKKSIIQQLQKCPNSIFNSYKIYCQNQLKQQFAHLQLEIDETRRNKEQAIDIQNQTAETAKQIREQQIEPLKQLVESFIGNCYN